jgi:hypothetical protein
VCYIISYVQNYVHNFLKLKIYIIFLNDVSTELGPCA